ncbi:MAG: N-acetyltransferase [Bacteroidota bacterium]
MHLSFRSERPQDYTAVEQLIAAAFRDEVYSDQNEHRLVARLRQSPAFIPELSIVAEVDGQLVGHALLTRIAIEGADRRFPSLALAPISVAPTWQRRGIGGRTIEEAHRVAQDLGHDSVVVLGHADYYPRFGYERASRYGIVLPFEVPEENAMVRALREGGLTGVAGRVIYPAAFYLGEEG